MSNENYLIISYFVIFFISLGLGIITFRILKSPVFSITRNNKLGKFIRKVFPIGIILPALIGFLSVSYKTCDVDTYQKIIKNRSYIIGKNQEQLSKTFDYIVIALVIWMLVIMIYFFYKKGIPQSHKSKRPEGYL